MRMPKIVRCLLVLVLALVIGAGVQKAKAAEEETSTTQAEEGTSEKAPTEEEISEEPAEVLGLEEIVVTATRTEVEIADVPASVTVIGRQEVEASPVQRVDDILRMVTGLDVDFHYGMHTIASARPVNFRGTGGYGQRTLVLIDGVLQNNPLNNWVEWSVIPKEVIERIEIVRGPASALYGSSAMGGVINIITRKPTEPRVTSFEQTFGSMGTWSSRLTQEGKTGRWTYLVTGRHEETDGYIASKPKMAWDIKRYREEDRMFGKLTYDIDESSAVDLAFSHYFADKGLGRKFFYGSSTNNKGWISWVKAGEKVDWKAHVSVNHIRWSSFHDQAPPFNFLYHHEVMPMLGLEGGVQSSIELSDRNKLTLGVDCAHNSFKRDDEFYTVARSAGARGKQHVLSPFVNAESRFADERLVVNLGGRYDWIEGYDGENYDTNPVPHPPYANDFPTEKWSQFSPRLGLAYHLGESTTLKSSIGGGFRAPSLYELYVTDLRGPLYLECNPQLDPEKITSFDLGIEHLLLEKVWSKLTLYQSHAKDFIGFNTITPTHWQSDNITKVRMRGIEAELDWRVSGEWSCFASYTSNESEIREYVTDPTVEGNYLPYTPRNKYGLGLSYANPELFDLTATYNYHTKRYADNQNTTELESYPMFNLSLARQMGKYCKLGLNVENLLDEEYTLYKGIAQDTVAPGRVVSASLTVTF